MCFMQYLRHNQNFVCYFSEIQMSLSILYFFWQHYPKSSTSFRDFPYSEQQVDVRVLRVESLPGPMSECKGDQKPCPFSHRGYILHHSGKLVCSGPTHPPPFLLCVEAYSQKGSSSCTLFCQEYLITIVTLTISRINSHNPDFRAIRNGVTPHNCFGSIVAITTAIRGVCVLLG